MVLDEIQLMDDALATSRQLDVFRKQFGIYGRASSVWMSATVNERWLETVDSKRTPPPRIGLNADDLANPLIRQRIHASKRLAPAPAECRDPKGCAAFTAGLHRPGTRSLIIANTVARARKIFAALREQFAGAITDPLAFSPGGPTAGPPTTSSFAGVDCRRANRGFHSGAGGPGVDITAPAAGDGRCAVGQHGSTVWAREPLWNRCGRGESRGSTGPTRHTRNRRTPMPLLARRNPTRFGARQQTTVRGASRSAVRRWP